MKSAKIQVIIWFFFIVSTLVVYRIMTRELIAPDLKQARLAYETEKLQLEREQLKRFGALENERLRVKQTSLRRENDLMFYGMVGLLSAAGLALLILAAGYSRARVQRASVHIARIGQHSEIPIHQKDLQSFYPIAVNLSLAEIEASMSTAHENAYRVSRHMLDDITEYTRALAGKRSFGFGRQAAADLPRAALPALTATPTFAELLKNGLIAPGKPLVLGYDRQGQPQYRTLQELKSVAITGWQGSGKTLSTGYLVASSVLADGVQAYVVDPHKAHPESLAALLKPLEKTGLVTVINPFDTPALLTALNRTLDRRLAGAAPSEPGILLVIDELERLAKMDCFDLLLAFLERCTEEIRKANITFIGGSHKWTARHFKGRADIRGCMNSMLIHKTKPSQADLLLEDAHDKHLVKQLQRPGEAILVTDYAAPTLVAMPLCTRQDMATVAQMVGESGAGSAVLPGEEAPATPPVQEQDAAQEPQASESAPPSNMISLNRLRAEQLQKRTQAACDPFSLTVEQIREQYQRRKQAMPGLTQAEVARQAGMSPGILSRILNGQRPLNEKEQLNLYEALFVEEPQKQRNARR